MSEETLQSIARAMVAHRKGILAADENPSIMQDRFDIIGIPNTAENRLAYRDMLFTTPNFTDYIAAVILCDETFHQRSQGGTADPFPQVLRDMGVVVGITLDQGLVPMDGVPGQTVVAGLKDLGARAKEYYDLGARFAKWRAVITITDNDHHIEQCIHENANLLATYAAECQKNNLVPIVEPEISMNGAHDLEQCDQVTRKTLAVVFEALKRNGVQLDGIVLKPSMIIPGLQCGTKAPPQEVAVRTVESLRANVPAVVPGIAFLSGGQTEHESTLHLQLMNQHLASTLGGADTTPWPLTFSYGRALQHSTRAAWQGKEENAAKAQEVFSARARFNGLASVGLYDQKDDVILE